VKRQTYLDCAYDIADLVWRDYDASRQRALDEGRARMRAEGVFTNPFQHVGTVAPAEAMRYRQTGERAYLDRARRYLLDVHDVYEQLKAYQAQQGIDVHADEFATLGWMFEPEPYISAYNQIKEAARFSAEETAKIETVVALSMRSIWKMPEYGPMNRSMLRALNLAAAGVSFPHHPEAARWRKMGAHIFADSLDKWSMEDSLPYQAIWLYSFVAYNDYVPTVRVDENPLVKHYADMWARMVTPLGFIPNYGDAHLGYDWMHAAAVMERCASRYRSGTLKYAVNRYTEAHARQSMGLTGGVSRFTQQLISAFRWADDDLAEEQPAARSQEACDDTIGRKCVFRDGWAPDSTYLLLNYRDAAPTNEVYRKNLTMTIPVKAEKTHHGHNDENALSMLVSAGRFLLTESGYRMGSRRDCTYRSDYYHNKVVLRGGVNEGHTFFDHVLDFGEYNPVRTERVFFYAFDAVDCSRTRLYDDLHGAVCDRVIYYLRREGCFVVNDIILPLRDGAYTVGPVYHAEQIEPQGERSFALSNLQVSLGDEASHAQDDDVKLFVHFPRTEHAIEQRVMDRDYREQRAVAAFFAGYASPQFPITFTSVLVPGPRRPEFLDSLTQQSTADGTALQFTTGARRYTIFDRYRYESKIEDLNLRPAYSFEAGCQRVYELETDAYAALTVEEPESVYFCAVDFSSLRHAGRSLFEIGVMDQLQLDFAAPRRRKTSWSNWDERISTGEETRSGGRQAYPVPGGLT
jgi:hypothetical protein